jgi:hypothetical protein
MLPVISDRSKTMRSPRADQFGIADEHTRRTGRCDDLVAATAHVEPTHTPLTIAQHRGGEAAAIRRPASHPRLPARIRQPAKYAGLDVDHAGLRRTTLFDLDRDMPLVR